MVGGAGPLELRLRLSGRSSDGNAEHGVLLGASQMGKTTAALAILSRCRNVVVIDAARKGQFDGLGPAGEDPDGILRHPVYVWQPPPRAVSRPARDWSDPWSRGLWYIREVRSRAGVLVYHDEARRTLPTTPHPLAAEMVDLGAGRGVGVWVSTQGYTRVYPPMFDNATHWLCFRVSSAAQRGTLAASLEADGLADTLGGLAPFFFRYWRQGMIQASQPHHVRGLGGRRQKSPSGGYETARIEIGSPAENGVVAPLTRSEGVG